MNIHSFGPRWNGIKAAAGAVAFALAAGVSGGAEPAPQIGPGSVRPWPAVEALPDRPELPDPFTEFNGANIDTAEKWKNVRRPELLSLVQHYMYGYLPPKLKIEVKAAKSIDGMLGGKANYRELEIRFPELAQSGLPPLFIRVALFLPTQVKTPAPVFIAINRLGNQTLLADERITIDADKWRAPGDLQKLKLEETRGIEKDFWCVEYVLSRGYAFASFYQGDIDGDRDDPSDGLHPHLEQLKVSYPKDLGPGTIACWAWGFHRVVDALASDGAIDSMRIAVIGHSRRGKTALLAAATDERIALCVPHQSGTGGMALSRNNDQETLERINRVFPHWFGDLCPQFGGKEQKLPIDQHLVAACVAPRTLFASEGDADLWANYKAGLKTVQAASPVWKLLGKRGAVGDGLVVEGTPISAETVGEIAQFRRPEKHTLTVEFWKAILDFADLQYASQAKAEK